MDREIFLHIDLNGEPVRVGRLWSHICKDMHSSLTITSSK